MNSVIEAKLKKLPTTPGVYFHKDKTGEIIYIGKASNLNNRVRQYFHQSRYHDPKTDVLVGEIADIDWAVVETEADALFLEAELVRRYQPRFNILLRDDKSSIYIRINSKSDYPTVALVRRPLDDGAEYFGPYMNAFSVKKALRYLRKAFPYATAKPVGSKRVNLHYHLGLDPGLEEGRTSLQDYRSNLKKLKGYLKGERVIIVRDIERAMKQASQKKEYEKAAGYRNQLFALKELNRQILFSDRELVDASSDQALVDMASLFSLAKPPRRIEGFDISHMQGTDTAASMVVFINGVPDKTSYRKFKMRLAGNDDFAHMREVIKRRLRPENVAKWGLPDFIIIDGGKGQLAAALQARDEMGHDEITMVGLAKRHEEIIVEKNLSVKGRPPEIIIEGVKAMGAQLIDNERYLTVSLPPSSNIIKFFQRIRDESHRFAVSYHTSLARTRQTKSLLDDIPGVGPATRKKLIKAFGSAKGVIAAKESDLAELLGEKAGKRIYQHLSSLS